MERFPHSHCKTKKKMMHVIILCLKYDACNFGVIAAIVRGIQEGNKENFEILFRIDNQSNICNMFSGC
jgi:RAB protein geranylgeranyltransferase component A